MQGQKSSQAGRERAKARARARTKVSWEVEVEVSSCTGVVGGVVAVESSSRVS